eukprot:3733804-Rhodomonas_salina.1
MPCIQSVMCDTDMGNGGTRSKLVDQDAVSPHPSELHMCYAMPCTHIGDATNRRRARSRSSATSCRMRPRCTPKSIPRNYFLQTVCARKALA